VRGRRGSIDIKRSETRERERSVKRELEISEVEIRESEVEKG
jgi:hypothetical protein